MIKFDNLTLYTIEETIELVHLSYQTIRNYLASGKLKGRKIASKWYVDDSSIRELIGSPVVSSDSVEEVKA